MHKRLALFSFLVAAGFVLALVPTHLRAADEARNPVVLELFTSQGCSSCPRADELLGDIAAMRDDVIALSFHVDYWNYIGWEDRFATERTTNRQRKYADRLGLSYVYTPQLVVDGVSHVVGSDERAVKRAIDKAQDRDRLRADVDVDVREDGGLDIRVDSADYDGTATVWLVNFDRKHVTDVDAGENTGRTLLNYHVVRDFRKIGTWDGSQQSFSVALDAVSDPTGNSGDGCAVIVQADDGIGAIIGAGAVWMHDGAAS